jgi:plastocyanin
MKPRFWILIALAVSAVSLIAGGPKQVAAAPPAASEVQVKIDNFTFMPPSIAVPVGSSIRWTNRDDIPHTVVSDDNSFKSKPLDTNDEFSFTFSKPGTYTYFCSIHPKMTGKVIVQ